MDLKEKKVLLEYNQSLTWKKCRVTCSITNARRRFMFVRRAEEQEFKGFLKYTHFRMSPSQLNLLSKFAELVLTFEEHA